ncbi:MAG TPA: recombinase family protein, partial [Dehalococcoidia bacterium]|nr:recombinase family protein [Dehalococcoidia bacterium]
SPETQLAAIPWLEAQGYKVPEKYIINIVWASQELLDSPAIDQKLIPWIKNEEIHAIGMLHSDRLACSPGTAGYLYELCQKHHVKLLAQIAPFQEGSSGEIMAMLADKSKRDAVVENRPRIKKGMGDRAILHGLPITGKPPYGYQIRYETRQVGGKVHLTPLAFEPDPATYPIAQRIFRLALEGVSVRGICRQLVAEGIKAPRGGNAWGTNTLLKILENPIYQGQYYALRHESIEPKKRGKPGETFGHSSHRTRDREEWHRLDFPIECPIISEQEYEVIKERLKHNKDMASCQRTTRRFYLLRVMIFCAEDGRRYVGYGGSRGDYYYICSRKYRTDQGIPQCPSPRLSGPEIEA